jgi:hypothetical protein
VWLLQYSEINYHLNFGYFLNALTGYIVGANGAIVKTVTGGVTSAEKIDNEIPAEFELEQNYPNPFNPVTKIKFDVAKFYNVKIIVYDLSGKELDIIINQPMQQGTYEVIWNGEKYSSGIYFLRMLADNYVETKKMVMLK